MNLKIKILFLLFLLILITGCVGEIPCTTIDEAAASITVERRMLPIVGLNADKDSLNFGVVSPTASVKRSINAQYSKRADVSVKAEGVFSDWVNIEPAEFSLDGNVQKVTFTVDVPSNAAEGIYTGRMKFCFRE